MNFRKISFWVLSCVFSISMAGCKSGKSNNQNEAIAQNISTKYRPHHCPALIFKDPSHGQVFKPETSGKHQNPSNEHSRKERIKLSPIKDTAPNKIQ